MAADSEAAFESVSWKFLQQIMKHCNFGESFQYYVKLMYLNVDNFSRILMDGYLDENIAIRQGIRQGDPVSGYLFNLAVEPLAHQIRQSKRLRGVTISGGVEMRLSQYTDDLIPFLDRPQFIDEAIGEIQNFFVDVWIAPQCKQSQVSNSRCPESTVTKSVQQCSNG